MIDVKLAKPAGVLKLARKNMLGIMSKHAQMVKDEASLTI